MNSMLMWTIFDPTEFFKIKHFKKNWNFHKTLKKRQKKECVEIGDKYFQVS